jgi:hypothetical protein
MQKYVKNRQLFLTALLHHSNDLKNHPTEQAKPLYSTVLNSVTYAEYPNTEVPNISFGIQKSFVYVKSSMDRAQL